MKKTILTITLMLTVVSCTVTNNPPSNPDINPSASVQPSASLAPVPTPVPTATPVPFNYNPEADYKINMETNMGTMTLKLFPQQAPKTVENFTRLAAKGYYDGLTFHRIIKDFMIQGGDPKGDGTGGESIFGAPFEDEFSSSLTFNRRGLLAMANSGPNTNGSQFFITLGGAFWLNNKHTIFGEVESGVEVLDAIGKVSTDAGDKPLNPVIMEKVTVSL